MTWETRYARPPRATLDALATAALAAADEPPGTEVTWVEHGSATVVALTDRVAVRVARQRQAGGEVLRARRLVDALPDLPFAVPRSLGEAVEIDGYTAVATRRLHGSTAPAATPDPGVLRELLDAVHAVDTAPVTEHLAPRRAFCGGAAWEQTLRERVVPLLDADLRADAQDRIDALAALEDAPRTLNHGDLGASNVLWSGDRVSGVIDWDLTAREDPAEDVATVATSFGLWPHVEALADPGTVRRADAFRGTIPLQIVAFAVLGARPDDEVARTLARAQQALRRTAAGQVR
ncbi:phosphotransferase [Isoptericola sp. 178]|uniref:phosphotransferase n=1 Tax=Isoptericola sp. 178 TaxID=3064651 RepID=UPI002712264B|nr:phosphotransferase [Isoptericola sp. 178]MDO8144808.1 phosphotransferase [Isoptericola sp. 178]